MVKKHAIRLCSVSEVIGMKKRIKLWVFLSILATGITVLTVAVFGPIIYKWVTDPYKDTLAFYCYDDTMICENGNEYTRDSSKTQRRVWYYQDSFGEEIYYHAGYVIGDINGIDYTHEKVYRMYIGDDDEFVMYVGYKPGNIFRYIPQETYYRTNFNYPEVNAEVVDAVCVMCDDEREKMLFDKETVNLLFEIYQRDKSYEEPENAKVYRYIFLYEYDVKGCPIFCEWCIVRANGQFYLKVEELSEVDDGYVYTYSKMDESEVHSIVNKVLDEGKTVREPLELKNYFARLKKAEQQ